MTIANRTRRTLIHIGKTLPFVLCFIVFVSYLESSISLLTSNLVLYGGVVVLNTPISFAIGTKFEYDLLVLFVITIISFAIETCYWNKLAIIYLAIHLWEKSYLSSIELESDTIYIIATINIVISGILIYKGIYNLLK